MLSPIVVKIYYKFFVLFSNSYVFVFSVSLVINASSQY